MSLTENRFQTIFAISGISASGLATQNLRPHITAMLNPDDLDPPRPTLKPLDLQQMSVEELKDYIAALEAENVRAQHMIAKKEAHKSGIESLIQNAEGLAISNPRST